MCIIFQLRDNIQALLHKCINNGMATIQMKVPPHDLQLSEVKLIINLQIFISKLIHLMT